MVFQLSHCESVQFPFVVTLSYTLHRSLFVSFRKPRPVSQLVAQQVNQQFAPPPHKKEKKERSDRSEKEVALRRKSSKKMRYCLRPSPLDAGGCHFSNSGGFFPLLWQTEIKKHRQEQRPTPGSDRRRSDCNNH